MRASAGYDVKELTIPMYSGAPEELKRKVMPYCDRDVRQGFTGIDRSSGR